MTSALRVFGWMVAASLFVFIGASMGFQNMATAAEMGDPVVVGHRYKIESKILGETRSYWVHKPARYDFTQLTYPVLILLDGDAHFSHTSAAVDFLSENGRIPQMLVVAIPNTNRARDLSPPITTPGPNTSTPDGAKNFLAFIGDELLPEIDRQYRTRPYRVLVGHSLGGLFAVYALTERPQLFNGYLPISPSLWWDNQTLVKNSEAFLVSHSDLRVDIYMTMGNEDKAMLGGFWKLSALLEEKSARQVRWQIKRSPEETHGSIPYRSTYDGLQAIFDGWYIHDPFALYEQGGIAGLEKHYARVSTRMGYSVPVPAQVYGGIVGSLNRQNRQDEVEALLTHAVKANPDSVQANFELARIYQRKNDTAHANEALIKVLKAYPGLQQAKTMLTANKVDVSTIVPDVKLTPKELESFMGEYRNDSDSSKVSIKDGNLFSTTSSGGTCELRPLSTTKFYCVNADVEITFAKDKRNRVNSALVQYADYSFVRTKIK